MTSTSTTASQDFLSLLWKNILGADDYDMAGGFGAFIEAFGKEQAALLKLSISDPGAAANKMVEMAKAWSKVNGVMAASLDLTDPVQASQLKYGQIMEQSYARQASSLATSYGNLKYMGEFGSQFGAAIGIAQIGDAALNGNINDVGQKSTGVLAGFLGAAIGLEVGLAIGVEGLPIVLAIAVGFFASKAGETLWEAGYLQPLGDVFDFLWDMGLADAGSWIGQHLPTPYDVKQDVNDFFTWARSWMRRDPLALDLDGDGIETVGATGSSTVLFDHDGDGIKTGTGWVKSDDGLLVLDKNNNGAIDNGSELFGVDYVKSNGAKATDGFDALRDLDSNHDGVFNSADAQYANVRVWRDLNQDGISQAGELFSLSSLGIASINLTAQATNQVTNGNVITGSASYTKTDGSTGTVNSLNLASNGFYSNLSQSPVGSVEVSEAAALLPNMHGSGMVRDLQQAATLSPALADQLAGLETYQTHDQLMAQLDGLINNWAATSDMTGSVRQAAQQGINLYYLVPGMTAGAVNEGWFEGAA